MSDKEFSSNDDLSLPKATVQKIITETLSSPALHAHLGINDPNAGNMSFAKETRDLLIECCVEFITMLSSEANEIAEKDAKKTIACEHITKALEDLGFGEYIPSLHDVAESFKTSQVTRERKQTKIEQSGMTNEELIRAQEELFRSAGEKYNTVQSPTEG
ncbi:hypothetical protein KC367_g7835 [Hortaea werneckii]|uniref:NCT transcriptional regulatory complex subunit B n=2 Tax=Hortaea werneckii TaxID=91943 RepID=A0A3M7CYE3_HORWE|nr:hypothetical protein KC361_g5278 [Hortaea werneckii]OTA23158.1 hypothetical protein BTJ68_13014 [Hortaea werneckii EXF-2000]KAI6804831.1 hypothetical protein KC358_g14604 [Hortaea werneckii]KAI6805422.1 hypothetical protein KC350_g14580 [Hortaea werneckii]KAI6811010.1 hypothetical protein KC358_g12153 [Hortaea werneckii]